MSKLLIDESPLSVQPSLAKALGSSDRAIILQQLHYLMNAAITSNNTYVHIDELWWVYNSYQQWHERYFVWISADTIKRHFIALEKAAIVISRQGVKNVSDRRKWYTINYDELTKLEQTMRADCPDGTTGQIAPMVGADCPDGISKSPSKSETPNAPTAQDASEPTEATAQAIVCNQCGERVDIQRGYIDNRDGVFTCYNCFTPDQRNRLEAVIAAQPTAQPTHAPGNMADFTTDKCPDCGEHMTWLSVWSSLHWRWCDVCGVKRTGYDAWHGQPSTEPFQDLNANPNAVTFPPPIDDNGNWVESLTHPGMMVERVEETLSYPPVEEAIQAFDVVLDTLETSDTVPTRPEPEPPAETLTKKQGAIIAKLLLSQGKPLAFAGSRDKSPISQLLIIGHIKQSLSRVGAWELTDAGQALAEHPHVTYAIALAGSIDAQYGVADKRGKKRTKGKFVEGADHEPVFNELCRLFKKTATKMTVSQYKWFAGVALECYDAGATPQDITYTHEHCLATMTNHTAGAIVKHLIIGGLEQEAQPPMLEDDFAVIPEGEMPTPEELAEFKRQEAVLVAQILSKDKAPHDS